MSPTTGTYSVPVSGPSAALAFLRALTLKAHAVARAAWTKSIVTLNAAVRLPSAVATGVHAVLSTRVGYTAVTTSIGMAARLGWSAVRAGACLVGRLSRRIGTAATIAVGYLSPAGADFMMRTCDTIGARTTAWATRVDTAVSTTGEVVLDLLHTPLVRTVVTATTTVASAVTTVHWISQGVVAARIVRALPFLMDAVVFATNSVRTLALVAVITVAAMAIAVLRLRAAATDASEPRETREDSTARPVQTPLEDEPELPVDWDRVAAGLRIEVRTDGSVMAHGIPDDIPRRQGERIARIATDAALRQFTRTRKVRPCPSRDDKRLFTKVAKEAIRDQATRTTEPTRTAA